MIQKLEIKPPLESYWRYPEPYKKIASYMMSIGMLEIGDIKYCDKRFMLPNGERRPSGLDLDIIERALRTLTIKKLTTTGLGKIHEYEQKKMMRFLTFPEIKVISRDRIKSSGGLSENQVESLVEFNNENRPQCRKLDHVTIPPYFQLDNEFDGMNYHHEWDVNVWHGSFELPERENERKASKILRRFGMEE